MIAHLSSASTTPLPARVAITSLGCKVNYAEMASLAGVLAARGFDVVDEEDHADIRVVNSCTVTLQADATTRQRIAHLAALDPEAHLIVTGCSVDGNPTRYGTLHAVPLSTDAKPLGGLVDAVFSNAEKEQIADYISDRFPASTDVRVPAAHQTASFHRSRSFIKVQDGCRHSCTYCSVWVARGRSRSMALATIYSQVEDALGAEHDEIVLTGVDLGSFGREEHSSLAWLVVDLLDRYPGLRVRLSSINANDINAPLIELNAHPSFCPHWHIPLQSGSDAVLKAMHRGYRGSHYRTVVERLRASVPSTTITTDIMTSFPGESPEDHDATLRMVDAVQFLKCHVFRYSPRPGTPAATLPAQVPGEIAKRRSAEIRAAAATTARREHERALGTKKRVVWNDRTEDGHLHGVAETYHTVVANDNGQIRFGTATNVMITGTLTDALIGEHCT